MANNDDYLVVLVTAGSAEEAQRIARELLENKLIACANLMPVRSLYVWEGEIQDDPEMLMILKTHSAVFKEKLLEHISATHSYDVPEVIGLPVVVGSADYLKWISDEVTG
ncbi:MAG: divalent-cation tolerance protein CutA [Chloroflexi bacterium]|nr:divalent-cation tolerance protein CutA [Chloroflexota bacterium]